MSDKNLQIEIHSVGTAKIVAPLGDIDMSNSTHLRASIRPILKEDISKIVLDLQGVPYVDSSALGTLIEGLQLANQAAISFILCNLNESVRSIITLSKLDQIFTIHSSKEDALAE
jgi:anti-anti-sigma factor